MKAFTKGQKVSVFSEYDRKGTVLVRHAVVHSCGNKRMVLISEATGECIGREYSPETGSLVVTKIGMAFREAGGTFPRMDEKETEATALMIAAANQNREREYLERRIEMETEERDKEYFKKMLAELHELTVIYR